MRIMLITFSLLLLITSCNQYPREISESLELAGKNRPELEKVLDHYSHNPADSIKYRAACFLVRNLRWHYGRQLTLPDRIWEQFELEDSLSKVKIANPKDSAVDLYLYHFKQDEKKKRLQKCLQEAVANDSIKTDLHTLTARFLINAIDAAFEVRNLPWNKHLTFDEFCEFILPYRFNNEPVFDVRPNLQRHFSNLMSVDSIDGNLFKAASALNRYILYFNWDWDDTNADLPDLGFYNIFWWNHSKLICSHHVAFEGPMLRAVGIPVTEIFTPKWRINNLGHSWLGMLNDDKNVVPFSAIYQNPGTIREEHRLETASKFYMKTFAAQNQTPYYLANAREPIPEVFRTPCIKDVTGLLVKASDVRIKISETPDSRNLCYFCLFLYGEWHPVGWGVINRTDNTVDFKSIPDGLVGMPCFFGNNKMVPCGNLVRINSEGQYTTIAPTSDKITLHLTRKYPPKAGLKVFNDEILGAMLEGSNNRGFSDPVKLFTLTDTLKPYFQDISFSNDNYFRYYRMTSPSYSLHFAELEFLTNRRGAGVSKATPLPIFHLTDTVAQPAWKLNGTTIGVRKDSLAFDGNRLTYTFQKTLTIDFGKPERIDRLRILPRNADNGITIGDRYQLFYWDNEWRPCGEKTAIYNFVQFENIPAGTIYWLRNLTKGQEEQPFFYQNDKHVFVNNN